MTYFPSAASCPRPKSIRHRQSERVGGTRSSINPQSSLNHVLIHATHATRGWVLCIDDDEIFLHGMKLRLESHGYQVVRSSDARDGCRIAREMQPSAIILDLCLPEQGGEQTLKMLKESPETSGIPVLVVTGLNEPKLTERLTGAGAQSLLNKPVDNRKLVQFLSSLD